MTTIAENGRQSGQPAMHTPPIVSPQAWEAAREQLLVKEKALTRARDALAAERRRMPWMAVETTYAFDGPAGKVSLLDLFDGRRQLIVYRAFFEPGPRNPRAPGRRQEGGEERSRRDSRGSACSPPIRRA
jgi:predicted dithiol-disulfide oxidoreductase (DUF899 family)